MGKNKKSKVNPKDKNADFTKPLIIFGLPADRDTIFKNHKGSYKEAIEKRQRKLIAKTSLIKFFLRHGETIRCLTTCYSPISVSEQVFTGPSFLYFKRAILIFTDQRIFHLPTSFDRSPHSAVSQIMYEDCAKIQLKGRSLSIMYKNGVKESFPYVSRKEKKKIKGLINTLPLKPKEAGRLKQRVHLCPSCAHILDARVKACDTCKLAFKTSRQVVLRTLMIPGGGYFYTHHPVIGVVHGLLEIALLGAIVLHWWPQQWAIPVTQPILSACAAALVLTIGVSIFHNQQLINEHMPIKKNFTQRKI